MRGQRARGAGEAFGIHADDRDRHVVEPDGLSEYCRRPCEFVLPELVADHGGRLAARGVVPRTNRATQLRVNTEHRVVVARHFVQKHALRVFAGGRIRRRRVERQEIAKDLILRAQLLVDRVRKVDVGPREQTQVRRVGDV